jgi:hypothetical protein
MRFTELTGKQFNEWEVLGPHRRIKNRTEWFCRCSCGNTKFVWAASLLNGTSKGCRNCYEANRCITKPVNHAARTAVLSRYKCSARNRQLAWALSEQQFDVITKTICFYCGIEPSKTQSSRRGIYTYNGIDRVDSSLGYVASNVVACCELCNQAKSDLTVSEFDSWIKRVYDYRFHKKSV